MAGLSRLVNLNTVAAVGFAVLAVQAYLGRDFSLASFHLLMAATLLLGQIPLVAPRSKAARTAADVAVILLAANTIVHYHTLSSVFSLIALVILASALVEMAYTLLKL